MKKAALSILFIGGVFVVAVVIWGVVWGKDAIRLLKAGGYIQYNVAEATELAHKKCAQCHSIDKTAKYCMRCGPPFVVVVHNMKTFIAQQKNKLAGLEDIKDGEAVAITQVWNALVGNWEDTWRKEDLTKLLDNDTPLLKLMNTPVKERWIEVALKGKSAAGADITIMKPIK
ncbi:MAG: hypothetical protein HY026_00330 [Deltaproteobacteria bacterium]|nr:hypothetical protein [Deltaproteobacteria bacterium]